MLSSVISVARTYVIDSDISYSTNKDSYSVKRCKLDVYHADDTTRLPVIVWFHGGGLTGGERFIPQELKNSGYVIVAPNYRLMPAVAIDDCIDDAASAVAWTFNNISEYGGDPDKIFVAGHSAGGYLTSMIGFEKKWLEKYGIDADSIIGLIPYSGQAITHFAQRQAKGISEFRPVIDEYAPLYHIRKDAPPYVIITGDRELELYGRYEENAYLWRMLKLIGHPDIRIYEIDGHGHGQMVGPAHHILKTNVRRILEGAFR
ncbi:alpha/beta hydrolase [uncultured Muribaculum sp.]|uniref:alpha/beta hydrolase n=1 Tax=uncultured Muribaculum sp. TaxID=1918613 RepID=UPI0025FDA301|nr:alpha/beta hydrolase [uncultured Muribaculum sp.]